MEEEQGKVLLHIARSAIGNKLDLCEVYCSKESWLMEKHATFVTLRINENLRGCIGTIEAYQDLFSDVKANAIHAAFYDHRFSPVVKTEFQDLCIEVSVLSKTVPIGFVDEDDLLKKLNSRIDGIVIEYGKHRSTFLPQVWESLPEPENFLAHLKRKAGLSEKFWSNDIKVWKYGLQKWKEKKI